MGVAEVDVKAEGADVVIRRADAALYRANKAGATASLQRATSHRPDRPRGWNGRPIKRPPAPDPESRSPGECGRLAARPHRCP